MIDRPDTWSRRINAFGALSVTAMIFAMMFAGLAVAVWEDDKQLLNGMMETVKALVMVAAGFWIGSSSGSQKKDDTIATATAASARRADQPDTPVAIAISNAEPSSAVRSTP